MKIITGGKEIDDIVPLLWPIAMNFYPLPSSDFEKVKKLIGEPGIKRHFDVNVRHERGGAKLFVVNTACRFAFWDNGPFNLYVRFARDAAALRLIGVRMEPMHG